MSVYSWFRRSITKPKTTVTDLKDDDELLLHGVTDQLLDFIKSFSIDTFTSFYLPDDDKEGSGDTPGNLRKDLSNWQQNHALIVLSKVKELSQLRFKLCPRYLKEQQFWTIYFALVKGFVFEYELRAIQSDKLKQMRMGNESSPTIAAYEVEMSETKQIAVVSPSASVEHN